MGFGICVEYPKQLQNSEKLIVLLKLTPPWKVEWGQPLSIKYFKEIFIPLKLKCKTLCRQSAKSKIGGKPQKERTGAEESHTKPIQDNMNYKFKESNILKVFTVILNCNWTKPCKLPGEKYCGDEIIEYIRSPPLKCFIPFSICLHKNFFLFPKQRSTLSSRRLVQSVPASDATKGSSVHTTSRVNAKEKTWRDWTEWNVQLKWKQNGRTDPVSSN